MNRKQDRHKHVSTLQLSINPNLVLNLVEMNKKISNMKLFQENNYDHRF